MAKTADKLNGKDDTPATKKGVEITQDKLDSLINEGFKKGAARADKNLMKSLGIDSLDEVKALLQDKKDLLKAQEEKEEASKSEIEKATADIVALRASFEKSESVNKALTKKMVIERVATTAGINDVDYFRHLHSNAISVQGVEFDETAFIEELKTNKPFLFGDATKIKIDNSTTKTPTEFSVKVKGAKTMAELRALQAGG